MYCSCFTIPKKFLMVLNLKRIHFINNKRKKTHNNSLYVYLLIYIKCPYKQIANRLYLLILLYVKWIKGEDHSLGR